MFIKSAVNSHFASSPMGEVAVAPQFFPDVTDI